MRETKANIGPGGNAGAKRVTITMPRELKRSIIDLANQERRSATQQIAVLLNEALTLRDRVA